MNCQNDFRKALIIHICRKRINFRNINKLSVEKCDNDKFITIMGKLIYFDTLPFI